MKTLYFDCTMGAAGDMLTAALLELFVDKEQKIKQLNEMNIQGVSFEAKDSFKCGIKGLQVTVKVNGEEEADSDYDEHNHEHHHEHHHDHDNHEHHHEHNNGHHIHRSMKDIEDIVKEINVSEKVKQDVMEVYKLIAIAESISHDVDVTEIHFHEVGMMDAIADITAVCFLMNELNVDKVVSSPINVGSGHVHCAHGILPVPTPATAYILQNIPMYNTSIESELCTPTGAALLKHFVTEFKEMPKIITKKIGYGMGKKDFEIANCVRVFLAEEESEQEVIYELSCNVDDMTGEEISFAMDRLFEAGANEVYTMSIGMKKSRPGNLIKVMCTKTKKANIIQAMFKHTTTIGIREVETKRYILDRQIDEIESSFGKVRLKISKGYDVLREKYEYDDLAKIALKNDLSIKDVREKLKEDINK